MESTLTKPEIDAVLQLIQLSNGSADGNFDVLFLKFLGKEKQNSELISQSDCTHEESVGEAQSSSSMITNSQKLEKVDAEDGDKDDDDDHVLPRRFSKFSSVADIYRKTAPYPLGEVNKGDSNHGKKKRKNPIRV